MGRIINRLAWMGTLNAAVFISLLVFVEFSGYADALRITPDLNHVTIAVLCLIWGMIGSFITLLISSPLLKWRMGARRLISEGVDSDSALVLETLEETARRMGFRQIPKLAVYPSDERNAFAVGLWGKYSSICISSGLLYGISRQELVGVLAHELAHIKNGDMITMTLMQGFINSIVLFAVRASALVGAKILGKFSIISVALYYLFFIFFQMIFGLLASVVIAHFSRRREYRADREAASAVGNEAVIAALESLAVRYEGPQNGRANWFAGFKMHAAAASRPSFLFASHPSIPKRIARIRERRNDSKASPLKRSAAGNLF